MLPLQRMMDVQCLTDLPIVAALSEAGYDRNFERVI